MAQFSWAAEARSYSLKDLEELALKVHPGLKKSADEVRKSEAELRIAKQYPNPEVEFEGGDQRKRGEPERGLTYTAALSQTVEWPGRRAKRQEAARFGIEAAGKNLDNEHLTVKARLREMFYRLQADEQFVKIAQENLATAKNLLDLVEKRVRLGESRQLELLKAQVEFHTLEREYQKAKTLQAGDRQVLNQFLLGQLEPDFTLAGNFATLDGAVPLSQWREAALTAYPLLNAQEAAVRQADSTLKAERQAWVPDVKLKFFHTLEIDQRTTGGGISVPLPIWNRKEGEVAKAAAARSQARHELALTRQELETKVASQYSLYETARRQVESFQKHILPQAAESLRLAQFSYQHGEISLLELLDARRVYRTTEQDYYKSLLDYWLARAELWRIAGGGI